MSRDREDRLPFWVQGLVEGREPIWTPAACGILALIGGLGPRWGLSPALALAAFAGAYAVGGAGSVLRSVRSLSHRRLDIDLLMLLSAAGAAAIGELAEGATLLFLFSLSNALEARALARTKRAIQALMTLRPDTATLLAADGSEREVGAETLVPGQRVRVRPGERIPIDGAIAEGETAADQSAITGESVPVAKRRGDAVFAGSINVGGTIAVTVTRAAGESALARIIALVEEAREAKAPTQRFIDRFEQGYAATVLFATAVAILAPLAFAAPFRDSFYRAMTLLVVASPCAVVIATPATILAALAHAARRGILFKGGAPLEEMAELDAVAFDKTGTLTRGKPTVTAVIAGAGAGGEARALALAAAVERLSEHHLGHAIVEEAARRGLEPPRAENLRNTRGQGVVAEVEGRRVAVGRPDFVAQQTTLPPGFEREPRIAALADAGATVVYVGATAGAATDREPVAGAIAIEDAVRPEAGDALAALAGTGVGTTLLLTGDARPVAERVGRAVGAGEIHAGLMPEDKVAILRQRTARGERVAMVGDGVNDAPALAAATVGVAMGVAGTDAALETADLVLVRDDLTQLAYAVRLARRARRVVRQNLAFACAVIAILVVITLTRGLALPLGVIGHEGSTILVVLNGLRLLRPLGSGTPRSSRSDLRTTG